MKQNVRRFLAISGIAVTIGTAGVASAFPVLAAENPKIKTSITKTKDALTIPIEDASLKNTKVKIKVTFTNEKTGKLKTKTFVKTLDANGDTTVKIRHLSADTQYQISVETKKDQKGEVFSAASATKEATTQK